MYKTVVILKIRYYFEQTICCICSLVLHFFQNIVSCVQCRGRVTGPGDVSRRKLGVHPSVELVTSVCSSFRPSTAFSLSRLAMSGAGKLSALLFVWTLCGVTGGSEAQTPAPTSRTSLRYLVHRNSPTLFCPLGYVTVRGSHD